MDNQIKSLYPKEGQFIDVDGGSMHFLDEGMSIDTDQPVISSARNQRGLLLAALGSGVWIFGHSWAGLSCCGSGSYRLWSV